MTDNQPHLAQLFHKSMRTALPGEGEANGSLPSGESPYVPFRFSNKPEFSLHFITAAGTMRSFQYAHLDSDSVFTAECITLRFMGMSPRKVTIQGRNLRQLYDYIHQHRTAYIREAARPFAADGEPIVSRITIAPVKEDVEDAD